ncbi:protein EPIDERMAL PATTERNING FACTOR 2-like isoform X2 [Phragmites australis]|uniref:protein EPIDERMAL PATTERNING FACTOR 2-like isoform X2 n=1 Tax=Phragmites australis TaxID=29695 RepID=UPI002D771AC1|nr:protein EPIDERMAL PATTERNING FACTOR 2-like isoform X2 [Phragmites australis]
MRRHATAARVRCILLRPLTVVLLLAAVSDGIRPAPADVKPVHRTEKATTTASQGSRGGDKDLQLQEEVRATGSTLPDCSHACGACSPCSRVMVSFKCSGAEPLPCPTVYRCMCRGKCYPVPSS